MRQAGTATENVVNILCDAIQIGKSRASKFKNRGIFVIETPDGVTVGVEVKAGSAVGLDSFKHLAWFRERMLQNKAPFVGLVLYTGEQVLRFGEHLWAVPIHALWGK